MAEPATAPAPVVDAPPAAPEVIRIFHEKIGAVALADDVKVSHIVASAWLPADSKVLLAESWLPKAPEDGEEPAAPPPAFDPTLPEYNELPKRLAKTAVISGPVVLAAKIKQMESELEDIRVDIAKRKAKRAEEESTLAAAVEEAKGKLAELEASAGELKASFEPEPTALVPWMQTLFALVDGGVSALDVTPIAYPHAPLRPLMTADNVNSIYDGAEKVLGKFLARYKLERGPGKVQVLVRMLPNIFADSYNPAETLEPLVDKIRANVFGADAPDALDLVQLAWLDVAGRDPVPTIRKLSQLAEDKIEVNEESGEVTVTEPKKIKAVGLVDFPYDAVLKVLQAGLVPASLSLIYGLCDASAHKTVALCHRYGIKVLARGVLMGGLIAEKYVGGPRPSPMEPDADLPSVPIAVDYFEAYGGWTKTQELLRAIKAIADKHGVTMRTVAVRWAVDQKVVPLVPIDWAAGTAQALDEKLTDAPTFLDAADVKALAAVVRTA